MRSLILKPMYARALEGLPLLGTPEQTAGRYLNRPGSLRERADEMAAAHIALCASTGFVCGLGGFLTLPVTLPANVAGVALVQLHLCASTAFLASHDVRDDIVRDLSIACLTGEAAGADRDEAQEVVDRSAVKVAERGIRLIAETAVGMVEVAGRFSATRFVTRKLPRRSIPLLGGMLGGMSDLHQTRKVAAAARDTFLPAGGQHKDLTALLSTTDAPDGS